MVQNIYHFRAGLPACDLILSESHRVVAKLTQFLTSFQLEGIRFLYKNFESNQACILNDESGLGKTASVGAFLSAIIPLGSPKKCLIIVKDDERATSWLFHLNALTKLSVKLVNGDKDTDGVHSVFLVTWDTLRKNQNLVKIVFNCIILDDRGDMTAAKTCLNFFMKHFENRISLIVASADLTLDIKQLHGLLRLCGRLDAKYRKIKVFEEKFSLPKPEGKSAEDRTLLEAYFQRREKIINYCRDFRLRRYRHQYEDLLPLVSPSKYKKSLQDWREKELSKSSSLSSGSLKIISSSSEKNTEELFQTYFDSKTEKRLNDEVRNINENASKLQTDKNKSWGDTEDMSPLLFESDSEEHNFPPPIIVKENISKEAKDTILRPKPSTPGQTFAPSAEKFVRNEQQKRRNSQRSPVRAAQKNGQKRSSSPKNRSDSRNARNLRSSDRKTRQSKNASRNATVEVFRMIERAEAKEKNGRRKARKSMNKEQAKSRRHELTLNVSSDDESDEEVPNNLMNRLGSFGSTVEIPIVQNNSPAVNYNFNIDLLSKTQVPDSSEIHLYTPSDQIVVLSSSTEMSEEAMPLSQNKTVKRVSEGGNISPSPDIFENYDEYEFICSQRGKSSFAGGRALSLFRQKSSEKQANVSCLDRLEDKFCNRKKTNNADNNNLNMNGCGYQNLFPNMVQIHSTNIGRAYDSHYNKITRYLSSQSFDSTQSNKPDTSMKDIDNYPKTPKRRMSGIYQKRSPKSLGSTPKTPTGLTKWLIKKVPESELQHPEHNKSTKRKRLDLFFTD